MPTIETRTDLINHLISTRGYTSYLEIGVERGHNLKQVVCDHAVGVDPDPDSAATIFRTSDEYFETLGHTFDLIFIDGLHHADQVTRDIENAIKHVNPGGAVVVHDCNPGLERMQLVPRVQECWTGDVWKAFARFRREFDYEACVLDTDFGCGLIECDKPRERLQESDVALEWSDLVADRKGLLGLVSVDEWLERTNHGENR